MSVATAQPKLKTQVAVRAKSPSSQFERYDTINTSWLVVIGFLSAIVTFVVILAAQALYFAADRAEVERKYGEAVPTPLTEGLTQQQNRLAGYGWVDSSKGIVNIPISDAMKLVVQEQAQAGTTGGTAAQ